MKRVEAFEHASTATATTTVATAAATAKKFTVQVQKMKKKIYMKIKHRDSGYSLVQGDAKLLFFLHYCATAVHARAQYEWRSFVRNVYKYLA